MNSKYITVSFNALRKITGPALQWQYNETQYLIIKGLNLPEVYAVDFMNQGDTETITMVPTSEGVLIPDQYLQDGRPLIAYIVVVDGESVNTIAQITFPVNVRGRRTDISPEPVEQQQIDSLIGALSSGVTRAEMAADNAEGVEERLPETVQTYLQEAKDSGEFDGPKGYKGNKGDNGFSPYVTVEDITGGHRVTITDAEGEHVFDVMDGGGDVQDVRINGTSILSDGVANIPKMTGSTFGVAKASGGNNGIIIDLGGSLRIDPADEGTIKSGSGGGSLYRPITPYYQHRSAFYGLAKAAGDTTQSASSNLHHSRIGRQTALS